MNDSSTTPNRPPVVWSIAGLDTAGGAGLSADQRAADALGVHLCPVVAAITAQHSLGVDAVFPVAPDALQAQLHALSGDLTPRAIKTGLLGSVQAVKLVAHWVDQLRASTPDGIDPHRHLALVVDPVLGASQGGAAFSSEAILAAYREHLLPRATLITPNRQEALRLLGRGFSPMPGDEANQHHGHHDSPLHDIPALAQALHAAGARAVMITGGDAGRQAIDRSHSLDWLSTPHASGWLCAPRVATPHTHGTGCTLASGIASALALGHVEADACVLGKMLTHHALMHGHAAGQGHGPVMARAGFAAGQAHGGAPLPWLGLGVELPWALDGEPGFLPFTPPVDGLYGIVGTSDLIEGGLQAGLRCLQLRHKASEGLGLHLARSITLSAQAGASLFINDHWQAALEQALPASSAPGYRLGLHLGQEDLLAMDASDLAQLRAAQGQVMLGLSSHSLWELARAAGMQASYLACGPVLPTTTKDMPWHPQGEDNLRWWVAQSPVPVVAIGGLLAPEQVTRFAACGAAALCVVRGLGQTPQAMLRQVPIMRAAVASGRHGWSTASRSAAMGETSSPWPHPVL